MILEVNFKKLFFLFILLNISCDFEPNYTLLKGSTFGTYYQVKFFEVDKNNSTIEKEIDSIFDHFNSSLSTYISSSTITKVNRNEAGWNSVYVAGKIIKKIGPILAINNKEFYNTYVAEKLN